VTARILVKEGYERASTNKIAQAAGVSSGLLYQYFPSKEALVAAVIDRHQDEMMPVIRHALADVGPQPVKSAVRELVKVMIDAHRLNPKLQVSVGRREVERCHGPLGRHYLLSPG